MTEQDDAPDVAVLVVTHNSADVLGGLLERIPEACDGVSWRLVVADNDSADESTSMVERAVPGATVIRMGRNAGYAAAINAAAGVARGARTLLVTNPDVRPPAGAVAELVAQLDELGAGIVSPRTVDESGRLSLTMRREPSPGRMLTDALLGGTRDRRVLVGETVTNRHCYGTRRTCDWATGAFLLVDRRCHEALGGWDPDYFLYSEETDFGLRARDAGWTWWYVPTPTVVHIGGEGTTSPTLYSLLTTNKVRLVRSRSGPLRTALFLVATVLFELLRAGGGRGRVHRAALRALLTSPLRRSPAGTGV